MTRNINGSAAGSFSELEEAFFRAGDEGSFPAESCDDDEPDDRSGGWWARPSGQARIATEPGLSIGPALTHRVVERRATTERPVVAREDEDEEWDWQIAIVRARVAADQ
ncbi:MAG: hypothetical protein H0T42_05985 [Deltaproteobacteria bacterium]|nr:hypothetical protein [Deltaproteobacteria bacterium]